MDSPRKDGSAPLAFPELLAKLEGMLSDAEAEFLRDCAARVGYGSIVEVGSWRGKSAIALAVGARARPEAYRPKVTCIDPHVAFTGVYGGKFGPADRKAFYEAMLSAGFAEEIALVNLPSVQAAASWKEPVGLLFLDGDHSYEGVKADFDAWRPRLSQAATVLFDDATDPAIGPARLVGELEAAGEFKRVGGVGKIVALSRAETAAAERAQWAERRATRDLIAARAAAAGYDEAFALSRAIYGSFVSRRHAYLYVETPKAACSAFKHLVAAVEGRPVDLRRRPYMRQSRLKMFIHQRAHMDVPSLLDLAPAEAESLLDGTSGAFVFGLVRNPYSRLVSVFENKIRLAEPDYRILSERWSDPAPFGGVRNMFADFLAAALGPLDLPRKDAHFRRQSDVLLTRLVPYTRIYRMEAVDQLIADLGAHLAVRGYARPLALGRENRTLLRDWRPYYDAETAHLVGEAFAEDFAAFGYDRESWRLPEPPPPIVETQEVVHWRAEVVARNAVIDMLYDELGLKVPNRA